jgi:hypothetical protein
MKREILIKVFLLLLGMAIGLDLHITKMHVFPEAI